MKKRNEKIRFWLRYLNIMTGILLVLLLGCGVYMIYQTCCDYRTQSRYFEIYGVRVDFRQQHSYSLGARFTETNDALRFDKTIAPVADIWLPTELIPSNIGVLKFDGAAVSLELNGLIDRGEEQIALERKILFPRITVENGKNSSHHDIFKERSISQEQLEQGIVLHYAEGGNQYMRLKLQPALEGPEVYDLLFEPHPSHLYFALQQVDGRIRDSMEISYGCEQKVLESDRELDWVHFPCNLRGEKSSHSHVFSFDDECIRVDGELWQGDTLPGSNVLARLSNSREFIFWYAWVVFGLILVVAVCYLLPYAWHNNFKELYLLVIIPLLVLCILYCVSAVLMSHYYFHFSFGNEANFCMYLISGLALPYGLFFIFWFQNDKAISWGEVLFCVVIGILICCNLQPTSWVWVGLLLLFVAGEGVLYTLVKKCSQHLWLFVLFLVMLACIIAMSGNQRIFMLPAHLFCRLLLILSFVAVLFFTKNKSAFCGLILGGGGVILYAWRVHDWGFVAIAVIMFALFLFCRWPSYRLRICVSLGIACITGYYLLNESGGLRKIVGLEYQWARIEMLKNDYEQDVRFNISDKESADKHRILLANGMMKHATGLGTRFNIPASFKSVIWSDYMLLYALNYFGLFFVVLLILFPLAVLSLHLFYVVYISCNIQSSFWERPLSSVISVALLTYISQYLYMIGAMFRICPLTGQSMPFLSVSWTETTIMIFFLLLAYVSFGRQFALNKGVETPGNVMTKLPEFSGVFFRSAGLLTALLLICVVFAFVCSREIPTDVVRHKRKLTEEPVYDEILKKLARERRHYILDERYWGQHATHKELVQICSDVIEPGSDHDTEVSKKVRFIEQEAAKLLHGRKSYLYFLKSDGNSGMGRLAYMNMEEGFLDRTAFAENLEIRPKCPPEHLTLGNGRVRLYKHRKREEFLLVPESGIEEKQTPKVPSFRWVRIARGEVDQNEWIPLYDKNAYAYVRKMNGRKTLCYSHAEPYCGLPLHSSDSRWLKEFGLTIDERLQALVYCMLRAYCVHNGIYAGGVVVLENETGKVRALVSYPNVNSDMPADWKKQEIWEKFRQGKVVVDKESGNVPLTGYAMASTWKAFQAAVALQIDPEYAHKQFGGKLMAEHIPRSTNPYSRALLTDLLNNHADEFFELMDSEFGISRNGIRRFPDQKSNYRKIVCEQATMGDEKDELLNFPQNRRKYARAVNSTALGQYNVRTPLLISVRNFARIISGKKVVATLFDNPSVPEFEPLRNVDRIEPLKNYLSLATTDPHATARCLRKDTGGIFDPSDRVYAKTGTGDLGKESRHTLLLFGNDKYSFGIFMYNRTAEQEQIRIHPAKKFAVALIPYVYRLCPEYLNK